jgi:MFS family permease
VFITTILFSPIFGKYINTIGSRNLFLYGTFLAGSTNILFGFLQYVVGTRDGCCLIAIFWQIFFSFRQ